MRPPPESDLPPPRELAGLPARWEALPTEARPDFGFYAPVDPDAPLEALDEQTFREEDERMPYFATVWPAGRAIARWLLGARGGAGTPDLAGRRLLDLGCGLGIAGLAAAAAGAEVTCLDWEARADPFIVASAEALGLRTRFVEADWRTYAPAEPFERLVAADVLYEARNIEGVLGCAGRVLAPTGRAWLSDPGRAGLSTFTDALPAAALRLRSRTTLSAPEDKPQIELLELEPTA